MPLVVLFEVIYERGALRAHGRLGHGRMLSVHDEKRPRSGFPGGGSERFFGILILRGES